MVPAEISAKLAEVSDLIAGVLMPDHQETELKVDVLKTSAVASALKIEMAGQVAFAKLFHDGPLAGQAFDRERQSLELLNGAQVPKLMFVAEPQRLILTSFIQGKTLSDSLTDVNLMLTAEHLGQWFGLLSNNAPTTEHEGSWAEYVLNYKEGLNQRVLSSQNPILEQVHIKRQMLAHNDNALSNFVLGSDRRIYGLDFEDCMMKPEGWDLITATRAFFRRFPDELQMIASAMLRGYRLSAKASQLPENFDQVIAALVLANLMAEA